MKFTRVKLIRLFLAGIATICFAIGWVGVFIPGLPTTVFWIVAAACAAKSCPVISGWIYQRGRTGALVKGVIEERYLPQQAKRNAIIGLWLSLTLSALILWITNAPLEAIVIGWLLIGTGVTFIILLGLRSNTAQSKRDMTGAI